MRSRQIWEHEVTCHPEEINSRGNGDSDYRVFIPDTIRKLGLGKNDHVLVEKRYEEEGIVYLVARKLTEEDEETPDSDSTSKIYTDGSSRLQLTLSADWRDEFIQYGVGDILRLEVNVIEGTFRIYRNDDYEKRRQELKDQGIQPRLGKPLVFAAGILYELKNSDISPKEILGGFDDKEPETISNKNSSEWTGKAAKNTDNGSRARSK